MADTLATSFGVLNYSGMLFNKGNTRTPLSSIIGGRAKITKSCRVRDRSGVHHRRRFSARYF